LGAVQVLIGHRFRRPELLEEALTHKSHAFERGTGGHNERLEFLGDSVLAAVIAHRLFELHPDEDEGRLSKRKAAMVSRATLARWGGSTGIGRYLRLGSGEESTGGRERPSILSNAVEAIIGAIYLDGGYRAASSFVQRYFLEHHARFVEADHKSLLQETAQRRFKMELRKQSKPSIT